MTDLKLWAYIPFELILHAEQHYVSGSDFDKRIALIGFDNSIEVAITTYLSLHPIQRGGREYKKEDCDKWLRSYISKIEFYYDHELTIRSQKALYDKAEIIWCHEHRNEQYHGGRQGVPNSRELENIRNAAFWIFSVLFEIDNVEIILRDELDKLNSTGTIPQRTDKEDKIIDKNCGVLKIGNELYYASDLLYKYDPIAYKELAIELVESSSVTEDE